MQADLALAALVSARLLANVTPSEQGPDDPVPAAASEVCLERSAPPTSTSASSEWSPQLGWVQRGTPTESIDYLEPANFRAPRLFWGYLGGELGGGVTSVKTASGTASAGLFGVAVRGARRAPTVPLEASFEVHYEYAPLEADGFEWDRHSFRPRLSLGPSFGRYLGLGVFGSLWFQFGPYEPTPGTRDSLFLLGGAYASFPAVAEEWRTPFLIQTQAGYTAQFVHLRGDLVLRPAARTSALANVSIRLQARYAVANSDSPPEPGDFSIEGPSLIAWVGVVDPWGRFD